MNRTCAKIIGASIIMSIVAMAAPAAEGEKAKDAETPKAEAAKVKPQETCPVTGEKIDKKLYVDANGKRIYVCCSACIEKIKADPAKYIKKLEDSGVTLEKAEAKPEEKKGAAKTDAKPAK